MFLRRLVSVVRGLFTQRRTERDLDRELEMFVTMSADEKVRDGLSPEEARRRAVLELGGIEQAKERVRTRRHGALLGMAPGKLNCRLRFRRLSAV